MEGLKRWLETTETSQATLAARIGVKQPSVSEWVNGKTFPTGKSLRRLAAVTGLSIDVLLSLEPSVESKSRHTTRRKAG